MSLFTFGRVTEFRIHDEIDHGEIECEFFLTRVNLAISGEILLKEEVLTTKGKGLSRREMFNPSGFGNIKKSTVELKQLGNCDYFKENLNVLQVNRQEY